MTTIAFDGQILAVDRAGWKANYTFYETDKLFVVPGHNPLGKWPHDCYYAGAGNEGDCAAIVAWLCENGPKPDIHERGEAKGMFVERSGKCYHLTGTLTLARVYTVPWADGGGADMALGAMAAGKSAPQAIEIVAKHSTWAAIGMNYVVLETGVITGTKFRLYPP